MIVEGYSEETELFLKDVPAVRLRILTVRFTYHPDMPMSAILSAARLLIRQITTLWQK